MKHLLFLSVLLLVPLSVYGSCESIHECMFANLEPDAVAVIIAPGETVQMDQKMPTNVHVFGSIPEGALGESRYEHADIILEFVHPDGTANIVQTKSTSEGTFSIWYQIGFDREDQGTYSIHGTYRIYLDEDEEEDYLDYTLGDTIFEARIIGLESGDHIITINPGASEKSCSSNDSCYDGPDIRMMTGETVEWTSKDDLPHRIHAVAIGYGAEDPEIVSNIRAENFFDTGILERTESEIFRFDTSGIIIYACVFHPWMEGTILIEEPKVEEKRREIPQSVTEVKEVEEEKRAPHDIIWLSEIKEVANGGRTLSIEYAFENGLKRSAAIEIRDLNGTLVLRESKWSDADGVTEWETFTQPTWEPGTYTIEVIPKTKNLMPRAISFDIIQDTIKCQGYEYGSGHGRESGCYAEKVKKIVASDVIRLGNRDVVLAVSNPINATEAVLKDLCPPGSVALVDKDGTLQLDSRGPDTGLGGKTYGVIYCDGINVNRHLLDSGLAEIDVTGCLTTEFSWGSCPIVEHVEELVEVTDDDNSDNCPIALAVYGTDLADPVQQLREYRSHLIESGWGPLFQGIHAIYYTVAPSLADIIRDDSMLRDVSYHILIVPVHMIVLVGDIVG